MPEEKTPAKKAAKKVATKKAAKKSPKKAAAAASGFSLDDALAVASTRSDEELQNKADIAAKEKARKAIEEAEAKKQKQSFGAASLADILGYSPGAPTVTTKSRDASQVPADLKKFYDLLIQLRDHVKHGLTAHSEETLKRSSKDDAGDLSGYSQHMADAGTDTFDRDFALSMVSSEQDALQEIEAAIDRIFDGTYGHCEMTGKRIRDERLMAVPFTRYSMKTQEQIEKNTFRVRNQAGGVFADASSEDSLNYGSDEDDS